MFAMTFLNFAPNKKVSPDVLQVHRERAEGRLQEDLDRAKPGAVVDETRRDDDADEPGKEVERRQDDRTEQPAEEFRAAGTGPADQPGTELQREVED